jgi:amino acid permease
MSMERIIRKGSKRSTEYPRAVYFGSTAFIIAFTGAVASSKFGLSTILSIIGATAGPAICYLFPAILYLKMTSGKTGKLRWAAKGLLVVTVPTTVLSLVSVIWGIVYDS